jgi:hypothetical protein
MYASVHHYSVDAKRVDEFMRRVDEKFAPRLEKMPGFLAYQAIDAGVDRARRGYGVCGHDLQRSRGG